MRPVLVHLAYVARPGWFTVGKRLGQEDAVKALTELGRSGQADFNRGWWSPCT
jgi:hypothetical protein